MTPITDVFVKIKASGDKIFDSEVKCKSSAEM